MLDYMTYCRYFAAHKSRYLHAREIRAVLDGPPWIGDNPSDFTLDSITTPGAQGFPTHCLTTGIPFAAPLSVVGEHPVFYPDQRRRKSTIDVTRKLSRA
jgi:hypothetical protein